MSGRVDENDNAFLMDVPGPLAALLGVRVDETDSLPPDVSQAVVFSAAGAPDLTATAMHVFDVVLPQGAEAVATYTEDFYAGTPAVTRNAFGEGEGWYVATCLDQPGVDWVVRRALDRHGLAGPFADIRDLEHTARAVDGRRYEFVLNHAQQEISVEAPFSGTDILTGRTIATGEVLRLAPADVLVVQAE